MTDEESLCLLLQQARAPKEVVTHTPHEEETNGARHASFDDTHFTFEDTNAGFDEKDDYSHKEFASEFLNEDSMSAPKVWIQESL